MKNLKTRKQLLNKECTHREFYAQFVTESHRQVTKGLIPDGENRTPLKIWDNLPLPPLAISMKEAGDYLTLSGKVCILKEAAKQNLELENKEDNE